MESITSSLTIAARALSRTFAQLADDLENKRGSITVSTLASTPLKVAPQRYIREGARDPASVRGRTRAAVKSAGAIGVTITDVLRLVPGVEISAMRAHLSILVKLDEVRRSGDRWFWI